MQKIRKCYQQQLQNIQENKSKLGLNYVHVNIYSHESEIQLLITLQNQNGSTMMVRTDTVKHLMYMKTLFYNIRVYKYQSNTGILKLIALQIVFMTERVAGN